MLAALLAAVCMFDQPRVLPPPLLPASLRVLATLLAAVCICGFV